MPQAGSEDFQFEIFLVAQAVGAALNDADFVVRPSTKPSATLFSGLQYAEMPSQ